ncbi:MAG TPA: isocitrate/isopropylmalate family dehydrogenase [Patescibacteria group bacterium]|jgi:3-isopropylmalate dehydrogenase
MAERTPDRIAVLPGIGIGLEVTGAMKRLLRQLDIESEDYPFGYDSIVEYGEPLTDEVLAACEASDAVLLGAVGTPPEEVERLSREGSGNEPTAEQGLLRLRRELDCFANLRPMEDYVPPSEDRPAVDLMLVRELLGGVYRGEGHITEDEAVDIVRYERHEVERIATIGFEVARTRAQEKGRPARLVSVDKANIEYISKFWRTIVTRIAEQYPDVECTHMFVDNAAMQIAARPWEFDVILTENAKGDILSDESAGRVHGSLGLAPSISLTARDAEGVPTGPDIAESVHGAGFDIAGEGKANPLATYYSVELMLRYTLKRPDDADNLRAAIDDVLHAQYRTPDMVTMGREGAFRIVSTNGMADLVSDRFADRLAARRPATSAD